MSLKQPRWPSPSSPARTSWYPWALESLPAKLDGVSYQLMISPQRVLNISLAMGGVIAPARSPTVPWDLDGGVGHFWETERRGEGWG